MKKVIWDGLFIWEECGQRQGSTGAAKRQVQGKKKKKRLLYLVQAPFPLDSGEAYLQTLVCS